MAYLRYGFWHAASNRAREQNIYCSDRICTGDRPGESGREILCFPSCQISSHILYEGKPIYHLRGPVHE